MIQFGMSPIHFSGTRTGKNIYNFFRTFIELTAMALAMNKIYWFIQSDIIRAGILFLVFNCPFNIFLRKIILEGKILLLLRYKDFMANDPSSKTFPHSSWFIVLLYNPLQNWIRNSTEFFYINWKYVFVILMQLFHS